MSRVNESIFLYNGSLFFSSSSAKKIWPTFWKNSISWRVHYLARTQNVKKFETFQLVTSQSDSY